MTRAAAQPIACPDCTGPMKHEALPRTFERRRSVHILRCSTPGCGYVHPALASGKPKGIPAPKVVRDARSDCQAELDRISRASVHLYSFAEPYGSPQRIVAVKKVTSKAKARTLDWLAHQLKVPRDSLRLDRCTDRRLMLRIYDFTRAASAEQIRDWAKAQTQPENEGVA